MSDPAPIRDPRPRPQYGEYASSDEQTAAGGTPPEAAPVVQPPAGPFPAARAAGPQAPQKTRGWDVPITAALLAVGAYSVATSIPGLLDLASTLRAVYATNGYGDYTSDSLAGALGLVAVILQVAIYLATAYVAVRRLRAKKLAVLVPLIGAVVAGTVILVLVGTAMVADPALAEWVNSRT